MEQTNVLQASKTYLIQKEVMKNTSLYFSTKDRDVMVYDLRRFILPIGHVLAFSFTPRGLAMVVQFHSEMVLQRLPRKVCDQNYLLSPSGFDNYLSVENSGFHNTEFTCSEQKVEDILKKKVSNFLHALAIAYNNAHLRKDRLSHRKKDYTLLETREDIRKSVATVLNHPVKHGECKYPEKSRYSSIQDTFAAYSDVLSLSLLHEIFDAGMESLKDLLPKYKKLAIEALKQMKQYLAEQMASAVERHLKVASGPRKGFRFNDP